MRVVALCRKIEDHPHDTQHRHEEVEAVSTALPVTARTEADHLHHHFGHENQVQEGGDHNEEFCGFPLFVPSYEEEAAVEEHCECHQALEVNVLGDVINKSTERLLVGPGGEVQGLGNLQTLLQVTPARRKLENFFYFFISY